MAAMFAVCVGRAVVQECTARLRSGCSCAASAAACSCVAVLPCPACWGVLPPSSLHGRAATHTLPPAVLAAACTAAWHLPPCFGPSQLDPLAICAHSVSPQRTTSNSPAHLTHSVASPQSNKNTIFIPSDSRCPPTHPHTHAQNCSVSRVKTVLALVRAAGVPLSEIIEYPKVFWHDPSNYTAPRLAYIKAHRPGL